MPRSGLIAIRQTDKERFNRQKQYPLVKVADGVTIEVEVEVTVGVKVADGLAIMIELLASMPLHRKAAAPKTASDQDDAIDGFDVTAAIVVSIGNVLVLQIETMTCSEYLCDPQCPGLASKYQH
jgi:hypothetical protein